MNPFTNKRPRTPPATGGSVFPKTGTLCKPSKSMPAFKPSGSSGSASKICGGETKSCLGKNKASSSSQDGPKKKGPNEGSFFIIIKNKIARPQHQVYTEMRLLNRIVVFDDPI
ncbi:hypothetical protein F4703DRAFT_1799577 [Phycomyces blakesleeanus]|uniref:Uncharacterized protein n=1 Tax=Phycomyces blakesleeanus (strain ATCC 8743b / DSM 1359 / FGSC 10004 / NBRC 33097 / NRRL 1555) TaxID=763407 RepID=A0A162TZB8_PHYB8|nr:hypothetical protein PHYBLDRAFT_170113 [Phycomyces blakesleeanus NRRL 1555(-)]OAD72222.1 hypothetical protein PHYBLDRAFT_170113 [Phycomyces blakesleeanus NRRL 1555(-)]|eukprot:XP_018290262.1 hypothetical protein PHYBLDRAFT_170113 [Phycomyces blakesleeanus NRRL 1555(-)]